MASPPSSPSPPPSPTPSITPSLLQSTFSHLPVMSMRKKIIDKIQQNRVTLIIGETGCGITSLTVWFFSFILFCSYCIHCIQQFYSTLLKFFSFVSHVLFLMYIAIYLVLFILICFLFSLVISDFFTERWNFNCYTRKKN